MKRLHLQKSLISSPIAFVCNLALVYLTYGLCRLAYLFENWTVISEGFDQLSFWEAFKGCWMFDTSAILYTNALYAILMLIPLHWKEKDWWQRMAQWVYVIINSICIIANLADAVYFQYTGRRTNWSVFKEFSNEGNIGDIVGVELLNHWYLVLIGIALIAIGLATWIYSGARQPIADKLQATFPRLHRWAYKRFYLDEVYQFVTHRIIFGCISRPFAWFDRHVVDGFFNGLAWGTHASSNGLKTLQSGRVQQYAFVFLVGTLLLILMLIL